MPLIAALILSDLIAEAKSNKSPLYVEFMDARKALMWFGTLDCFVTCTPLA